MASAVAMRQGSSGNIPDRVILDASGEKSEPRGWSAFDFLFFHPVSTLRVTSPYFVPHGLPALARFAILSFHSHVNTAASESRLPPPQNTGNRNCTVRMPRRPQKTGGLL